MALLIRKFFRELREGAEFCFPKDEDVRYRKLKTQDSKNGKRIINCRGISPEFAKDVEFLCDRKDVILHVENT